jgi:YbbR domain-containing protein
MHTYTIPVCFYNIGTKNSIHAPETVAVQLRGTRTDLAAIDTNQLAVHIDATSVSSGKHPLEISNKTLLLPNRIQVVYYSPMNSTIEL